MGSSNFRLEYAISLLYHLFVLIVEKCSCKMGDKQKRASPTVWLVTLGRQHKNANGKRSSLFRSFRKHCFFGLHFLHRTFDSTAYHAFTSISEIPDSAILLEYAFTYAW